METISIGQRIRYYRQQRGITQMELAERIGVSYQQIQKYERDRSQITIQRLSRIAEALEIHVLAFLTERKPSRFSEKAGAYIPDGREVRGSLKEERSFLRLFTKIKSPKVKRSILRFLESIVEEQDKS